MAGKLQTSCASLSVLLQILTIVRSSETEDHRPVFYIGTEVYSTPTAQCISPCSMVFAPSILISLISNTLKIT
ncbi:hypothetical protein F5882DRAFT_418475 [Hyaloscypha sp. PMI_1271]|nr:hypothetical protein F5882DRAFT_418475 [Hyaloscypha sp. PMI_1271]